MESGVESGVASSKEEDLVRFLEGGKRVGPEQPDVLRYMGNT